MALAYFITFTTYGTWLHGSAKGSVDDEHSAYAAPFAEADAMRERHMRGKMVQPAYAMSQAERMIVCKAVVDLARDRGWLLLAVHVRTNHVHVVISAERDPGRIMSDMKARASRDLTGAGFGIVDRKRWTRHGSTQHLFHDDAVVAKIRYTLDEQGERMAWYAEEPRTK